MQTVLKLMVGLTVLLWSLFYQCSSLRQNFRTDWTCQVLDYSHSCSIPSNKMNMFVFDLCNVTLCLIVVMAIFSLVWHVRFYARASVTKTFFKVAQYIYGHRFQTDIVKLVYAYLRLRDTSVQPVSKTSIFQTSPDMQMLLSLLVEKEGMWSGLLVLTAFDAQFRDEFRIQDSKVTSMTSRISKSRKDIVLEWNEPTATAFIDKNVPSEHLMYVLEIDPPLEDQNSTREILLLPACNEEGGCVFNPIDKTRVEDILSEETETDFERHHSYVTSSPKTSSVKSTDESRKSSSQSVDKSMNIVDVPLGCGERKLTRADSSFSIFKRKVAAIAHRKTSVGFNKSRKFRLLIFGS